MAISMTGIFARRAANNTTGIRMTTPTSKNMGMPTVKAMSAMAQGSSLIGVLLMMVSTITSAPPDANRMVPMMAPNATSSPTPENVEPAPGVKLLKALSYGTPAQTAMTNDPTISEMKGCSLATAISRTMVRMPTSAAMMSCMSDSPLNAELGCELFCEDGCEGVCDCSAMALEKLRRRPW